MPRITAAPGEVKRVLRMAEECGIGQPLTKGDRFVPLRRIVGACRPAVMEGVMVWVIDDVQKTLVVDRQRGPAVVVMGWPETVDGSPCAGGVIESSDLHAKPAGK